jgi:hypothetical protein
MFLYAHVLFISLIYKKPKFIATELLLFWLRFYWNIFFVPSFIYSRNTGEKRDFYIFRTLPIPLKNISTHFCFHGVVKYDFIIIDHCHKYVALYYHLASFLFQKSNTHNTFNIFRIGFTVCIHTYILLHVTLEGLCLKFYLQNTL